jgi:hypothetical protein
LKFYQWQWGGEAPYPLAGLRNITVTKDNQIILDLPGGQITLREEAMTIKGLSAAGNNRKATEVV